MGRIKRKTIQSYVNHMWENLLLACIGEAFEMPDVVGVVLSTRLKDDVLSIWNLSNRGTQARFRIGEKLKEVLDLNMTALIQYKDHMASLQDYSTYRNAKNYMFAPSPAMTPLQRALDTPAYTHQDSLSDCGDGAMLPPAAMDDLLPPAAVDSEGFTGLDGWGGGRKRTGTGSSRGGSRCNSATVSPNLSALRSPALGVAMSPSLSAAAAPWFPPGVKAEISEKAGKEESSAKPSGATAPSNSPTKKSWAAIAAGK